MRFSARKAIGGTGYLLCLLLGSTVAASAQSNGAAASAGSPGDLDAKIRTLSDSLEQTRVELSKSRAEIRELRSMLEQVLKIEDMQASNTLNKTDDATVSESGGSAARAAQFPVTADEQLPARITQDEWEILKERLDEFHQLKVESASKYRLKLSGLVLLNISGVSGQVDNTDVPTVVLQPSLGAAPGSVGASLRQTILGLEGIGPTVWGAKTSADVQMDFFGGLPSGYGAYTSGLARLRTARVRFDWANTSIVGGLDVPFFSPNTPSTYLTVAEPAFAAAGNLWAWTPTMRLEQRFDASVTQIEVQAGFLDAPVYSDSISGQRNPSPGESSRQATYAVRVSASGRDENHPISFGVSGVYSPQRYTSDFGVSGWGAIGDWKFPILQRLELSGQVFGGRGLDGFGGLPTLSTGGQYFGFSAPGAGSLEQITMFGGWSQLKVHLNSRSEFNFDAGMGGRSSSELRVLGATNGDVEYLSPRNQMLLANYIFRPRSDLVFSPEFRRIRTYPLTGAAMLANQFGVSAGFLF